MIARLSTLIATAALALAAAGPALANEPFWTQRPNLTVQGNQLYASNGGWYSYSGPVTKILYRFLRDGVVVKGLAGDVPKSTAPSVSLPGVTPDDPNAPYYALTAADNGHCFVAEVWGGTHSEYVYADGTVAYDVWEWGHLNTFGAPAVTNQVCVGDAVPAPGPPTVAPPAPPAPTPPPPPPPAPPKLAFTTSWIPNGSVGADYSSALRVEHGTSVSFSVSGGSLPPGLSLSATGVLSGTPTAAGTYNFTVTASDTVAVAASQSFAIQIGAPALSLGPQVLRGARADVAYSQQLVVLGGFAPYAYSVTAGALPKGMTLTVGGLLSGTPDATAGNYTFTVSAVDRYSLTTSLQLVLTVLPPRMRFDLPALPQGIRGRVYEAEITASGASAPYAFRIAADALPAGLVLDASGRLHGRPTRIGSFAFTVQATDANGVTRLHRYALRVRRP
jgi:hypothetical protein